MSICFKSSICLSFFNKIVRLVGWFDIMIQQWPDKKDARTVVIELKDKKHIKREAERGLEQIKNKFTEWFLIFTDWARPMMTGQASQLVGPAIK